MPINLKKTKCKPDWYTFTIPSAFATVEVLFDKNCIEHCVNRHSCHGSAQAGAITVMTCEDGNLLFEVYFKPNASAGVIAHEALHVVTGIAGIIGSKIVGDEESWAYMLQYIVGECLDIQRKVKKSASKKSKRKTKLIDDKGGKVDE